MILLMRPTRGALSDASHFPFHGKIVHICDGMLLSESKLIN